MSFFADYIKEVVWAGFKSGLWGAIQNGMSYFKNTMDELSKKLDEPGS